MLGSSLMKLTHFLKQSLALILTVASGLAIGYAAIRVKEWTQKPYIEGDYSAYFAESKSQVVLYGTASCPYCKEARSYLHSKAIIFVDYDVDLHERGRNDFQKLRGQVVPLILIGNRQISGFDKNAIDDAIAQLNNG